MAHVAPPASASDRLERLAEEAVQVGKKARRNRQNLAGDNFYANKMATLRTDATNALKSLAPTSAGGHLCDRRVNGSRLLPYERQQKAARCLS